MKQVIHIFGASGSGTSTLGREFCRRYGFRFLDTDDFYWLPTDPPFTHSRPLEQRLALLEQALDRPGNVVLSGAMIPWGNPLISRLTLAVRLHTDASIRLERLRRRERARFGNRLDPGGDRHRAYEAFLEWAASYDTGDLNMRSKAQQDQWQKRLPCPVILLDGAAPLQENVERIFQALKQQNV